MYFKMESQYRWRFRSFIFFSLDERLDLHQQQFILQQGVSKTSLNLLKIHYKNISIVLRNFIVYCYF